MKNFKGYTVMNELGNNEECLYFNNSNAKGETMIVTISHNESYGKKSLPYMWYKKGYTDREINKYLTCRTYVEKIDSPALEKYNPQLTKNLKINFEWLLEDTEENKQILIDEIAKRFFTEE